MRLEPVQGTPGLWRNPAWSAGDPGTFAVIIGVSRYTHLEDGDSPAPFPYQYGLGQLFVSALTAYSAFAWMRDDYDYNCAPAEAWLLLSPTAKETAAEPALSNHLLEPTFANCKFAIRSWSAAMSALPVASARKSRALFLFSGHGLEITQDKQILLPKDYLAPPAPAVDDAISISNLLQGLASHPVGDQLFFSDACRNDHTELRKKSIQGAPILNVDLAAETNPERNAPVIYASGSGAQAFQPIDPKDGISLFGHALVDGLTARSAIQLECDGGRCHIKVPPLLASIRTRANELARALGHQGRLLVPISGYQTGDATVTIVPPPTAERGQVTPPPGFGGAPPPTSQPRLHHSQSIPNGLDPTTTSGGDLHQLVGSEFMTAIVQTLRLRDATNPANDRPVLLRKVERTNDTRVYRMEIEDTEEGPTWLSTTDGVTRFDTVLSGDRPGCRYTIDINLEYAERQGEPRLISAFSVDLARDNPGRLGQAADAWHQYQEGHTGRAVSQLTAQALEELLYNKIESPLAATLAALILLRVGRLDLLHDWPRNLARWFPHRPDGTVIRVAQLLREQRTPETVTEATSLLVGLKSSSLPHTAEAFGLLEGQIQMLIALNRDDPAVQFSLDGLLTDVRSLQPSVRPGGMFVTFATNPNDLSPLSLYPIERPVLVPA